MLMWGWIRLGLTECQLVRTDLRYSSPRLLAACCCVGLYYGSSFGPWVVSYEKGSNRFTFWQKLIHGFTFRCVILKCWSTARFGEWWKSKWQYSNAAEREHLTTPGRLVILITQYDEHKRLPPIYGKDASWGSFSFCWQFWPIHWNMFDVLSNQLVSQNQMKALRSPLLTK